MASASSAIQAPTPATIVRLYRIILYQAGAAVLFAKPAVHNLRALYRPELDIWMQKAKGDRLKIEESRHEWEEFARRGNKC